MVRDYPTLEVIHASSQQKTPIYISKSPKFIDLGDGPRQKKTKIRDIMTRLVMAPHTG